MELKGRHAHEESRRLPERHVFGRLESLKVTDRGHDVKPRATFLKRLVSEQAPA